MSRPFAIESWAPEYGSPVGDMEAPQVEPQVTVDAAAELPLSEWRPVRPGEAAMPGSILFVDGVRRIDARAWFDGDPEPVGGLLASFAAGVVRCDGRAEVEQMAVGRGVFGPVPAEAIDTPHARYEHFVTASGEFEKQSQELQTQMGRLEREVAEQAGPADLVVLDGPLFGRENIPGAVGYIKSHQVGYLPPEASAVVGQLAAGDRTPVFLLQKAWSRYSWYVRLPMVSAGHPWAGIARCEVMSIHPVREVIALADAVTATLPRFASTEHKDTRAPQNLFPIAGLESQLRRRLGDREFLYRALRVAAGQAMRGRSA